MTTYPDGPQSTFGRSTIRNRRQILFTPRSALQVCLAVLFVAAGFTALPARAAQTLALDVRTCFEIAWIRKNSYGSVF
jgi:hypothetical protein